MISLEGIEKQFHGHPVLRGISLSVPVGEVAVLLGPSGSGKSTLLRTINGLESFDAGEIRVGPIRLGSQSDRSRPAALVEIRKRVGMVFQQFNLFPHRTVLQNVIEAPIYVRGEPREQAISRGRELLRRVGLAEKENAWPGSLSGGQQQRVAIARSLAMCPEVILFDEPTSALDPRMTAEVVSVMRELASAGQTMIVVTHAMEFAREIATTVHVLDAGQIVEGGTIDFMLNESAHPTTRFFVHQMRAS